MEENTNKMLATLQRQHRPEAGRMLCMYYLYVRTGWAQTLAPFPKTICNSAILVRVLVRTLYI